MLFESSIQHCCIMLNGLLVDIAVMVVTMVAMMVMGMYDHHNLCLRCIRQSEADKESQAEQETLHAQL
jgi:hypothetical protein